MLSMYSNCTVISHPATLPDFWLIFRLGLRTAYIVQLVCIFLLSAFIGVYYLTYRKIKESPSLTKIRLQEVQNVQSGRRAWAITVTNNGKPIHAEPHLVLHDPFQAGEYLQFFKFLVDDSFQHQDDDPRLVEAKQQIRKYAAELLGTLQLDNAENEEKQRNIVIVEELQERNEDTKSLHNAVWEVLEDVEHWEETKPEWVNVTRALCPSQGTLQCTEKVLKGISITKPIRMLLVIGRNLVKRGRKYEDEVEPHLVQRSIMQVVRHLEHIGHCRSIQLDILRPSTFKELEEYLKCLDDANNERKRFDIIHLDMHGTMLPQATKSNGPKNPHLVFTRVLGNEQSSSVSVSQVAEVLRARTKLLVMNACNSSSVTGELGIRMVRSFLDNDIPCVSATSYRLLASSARIFYPRFYMSLFLYGSFIKAAADARLALRNDKKRHWDEERQRFRDRDDHFVHWNWSSSEHLRKILVPSRSLRLHLKMLSEVLPRIFSWCTSCLHTKRKAWQEEQLENWPMYTIHRKFSNLECHVRCAQHFDIPGISNYALEVEHHLKNNDKHSVYLYPPNPRSDRETTGLRKIQNTIRNMVRIWVDTNFVTEVRVLQVDKMLQNSWPAPWAWSRSSYKNLVSRPDWTWRQTKCTPDRKQPRIRRMLIIDGIDLLVDDNCNLRQEQEAMDVWEQIVQIAEDMKRTEEDIYVLTIGGILEKAWERLSKDFDRAVLGQKFAGAKAIMLEISENVELATYTRKTLQLRQDGDTRHMQGW